MIPIPRLRHEEESLPSIRWAYRCAQRGVMFSSSSFGTRQYRKSRHGSGNPEPRSRCKMQDPAAFGRTNRR